MGAMSDHLVRRGLRFWLRSVVAAMLGFLLVGLATPAMAHTTLIDAGPGKGDEVATGTNLIALKFGEVVQTGGTLDVAVLDSNEDPVAVSDSQVLSTDGSIVCTRVADLEPGVHTVRYEVTAADGHDVRGNYQFTVADGAAAAETLGCEVAPLDEPTQEKSLDDQDQGDFPAWAMWLIGAVVVVTAGLAVVAIVRSRRDLEDDLDDSNTQNDTRE